MSCTALAGPHVLRAPGRHGHTKRWNGVESQFASEGPMCSEERKAGHSLLHRISENLSHSTQEMTDDIRGRRTGNGKKQSPGVL